MRARHGGWARAHNRREQAFEALVELLIAGVLSKRPWMSRLEVMEYLRESMGKVE